MGKKINKRDGSLNLAEISRKMKTAEPEFKEVIKRLSRKNKQRQ